MQDSIRRYDIWAESFKQWAEKDMSLLTIVTVSTIIVLMVAGIVLYEVLRSNKARRELQELAWKKFDYSAKRLKLSLIGVAILKEVAYEADLQDPDAMIKSSQVLEIALEKYYKRKKIESIPTEKLDEIRNLRKALGFLPLSREMAYTSTRQFDSGCVVQIAENGIITNKGTCHVIGSDELMWHIDRPVGFQMPIGSWLHINMTRPGDAEYAFNSQILHDSKGELSLSHAVQLNRTQQRNWVRIDVSIPVEITQVTNDGAGDIFFGKIIDLSGGGCGMALPIRLAAETFLKLTFELPGHGQVEKLLVKVTRVAGAYNNDASKTVHSVAFEGDVNAIQEQIIQYVFEKQRKDSLARNS